MKDLGALLRTYISECGYTIYKAASLANVNRTTLQKVLSGDRALTEEFLNKLLPILKLSAAEETELRELYEIEKTGESIHRQRNYILHMLKSVPALSASFTTPPPFLELSSANWANSAVSKSPNIYSHMEEKPICGRSRLALLFSSLLFHACAQGEATLLINVPGNFPLIQYILNHPALHEKGCRSFKIWHITPLLKAPGFSSSPLTNLEILSALLPHAVIQPQNYEARLFYSHELLSSALPYAFPYWIVCNQIVLLISADGENVLPFTAASAVTYFKELFYASWKQSHIFLSRFTFSPAAVNEWTEKDVSSCKLRMLRYQPYLSVFLDETAVQHCIRAGVSERDALLHFMSVKGQRLSDSKRLSCIFSQAGLMDFADHGRIWELPSSVSAALEIAERIHILRKLYWHCKYDTIYLRIANPFILPLPEQFSLTLAEHSYLYFCSPETQDSPWEYVRTAELTLMEAFNGFYEYLADSKLIYTKEETLKEIDRLINVLSQRSTQ